MAEKSIFWTTGSTGDGASEYTMAELTRWLRQTYLADNTDEGVCKGYGGDLEVTGTSSPVSIATGGALVYGFPYWQTAASTLTIPTPSGDTRIDRVVLSADWTAQTVRLEVVSGVEGGAAPALTQTDGVEWQVSLAQCSITTGGVITVTDERIYLHPGWEIEAAQLGADLDGDGIQGGDGSALAIDPADFAGDGLQASGGDLAIEPADFAGDGLEDDGSDNLQVKVDDATIEISADTLQIKAGGLDNSHIANRTRTWLVQASEAYDTTTAAQCVRNVRGWELTDDSICHAYASFSVPTGWAGTWTINPVYNQAALGRVYGAIYAYWGEVGESYTTHSDSDGFSVPGAASDAGDIVASGGVNLSISVSEGDIVKLQFSRDADGSDTIETVVYFMGFLISCTADM